MRGRPFGFMALLCLAWISTRAVIISREKDDAFSKPRSVLKATAMGQRAITNSEPVAIDAHTVAGTTVLMMSRAHPALAKQSLVKSGSASVTASVRDIALAAARPVDSQRDEPMESALATLSEPRFAATSTNRLNVYAYSFWRKGSAPAGFARYGGGQSAIAATYRLRSGLSLLGRASIAHNDANEREVATGLRWSRLGRLPVSLTAERRFRGKNKDVFAAYIAGGKSGLKLPLQFRLDAFGQAGVLSGKDGRYFFDAQAKVQRTLDFAGPSQVNAGAGIWTGGQRGISRVDIGPSIGVEIPIGATRIRVDADWRFRIAGNAKPGNGPALTLSTSF